MAKRHYIPVTADVPGAASEGNCALIRKAIRTALALEAVTAPCEVDVLLTNDEGIHQINLDMRGVDRPTDVLSFPEFDLTPGQPPQAEDEELLDPATGLLPLGDMVISMEHVAAQAKEYGHSKRRELAYLTVHSVLHLLGYDHLDEGPEKARMRQREEAIMAELGLERAVMTACVAEGPAGRWYADMAPGYTLRPLTEADIPAMLALCEGNPRFYQHCPPPPTAEGLAEDLTALPPGKSPADKHFLGFWREGRLTAMLDLIEGYPAADTAWIGFFMTARETQGKGEGTALIGYLLRRLEERGYARVGLAYAKGNPQSQAFWQKNGFTPTGREKDSGGYTAVVMERLMGKDNK